MPGILTRGLGNALSAPSKEPSPSGCGLLCVFLFDAVLAEDSQCHPGEAGSGPNIPPAQDGPEMEASKQARLNSQSGTEKHCEKRALIWMHQSTATETNKPQSQRHLQEADQALCDQQAGLSFGDENTESIRGSGAVITEISLGSDADNAHPSRVVSKLAQFSRTKSLTFYLELLAVHDPGREECGIVCVLRTVRIAHREYGGMVFP
ncbi:hypothetical protein E5288_WYG012151 [Bos mutus]|uniref:Uncharacterized protein n=1 Tax=Bos mutus TaxID=72004 RepID=A0A6B0R1T2_9CETA|nr:hypothetical protein [Bos mutus]